MEELNLNGKKYILEEDINKEYIKKEEAKKSGRFDPDIHLLDEANVLGIGSVKINEEWRAVKVTIDYLKKAISILEKVTFDKKRTDVVLIVSKDYPLLVGDVNGDKFSGVIIAPRIDTE